MSQLPVTPGLGEDDLAALDRRLAGVDAALERDYPGERAGRQPVHTVYVPADAALGAGADLLDGWGRQARATLDAAMPDAAAMAALLAVPTEIAEQVRPRVLAKLAREPVEDLRLDFEDGYGARADAEEDDAAVQAAQLLVQLLRAAAAPPYCGIRCKSLEAGTRRRGLRTLDLFLGALRRCGPLPDGFVVTVPKVSAVEQVDAFVEVCARLETAHDLPAGALRFELQVETPPAVLGADGTALVARMIRAAAGRCVGLHFGTYDFSAACGVTAAFQSLEHPLADHAKAVMALAAAGTGVRLSDGSTNVLPVGEPAQVRDALRLHARLVRRSLERALYQGWDLHPGQLVTRYAATYAFYRQALPAAAARLRAYAERAGGGVLDEPATAAALATVLLRGRDCGAVDDAEVRALTGLDPAVIEGYARRRVP